MGVSTAAPVATGVLSLLLHAAATRATAAIAAIGRYLFLSVMASRLSFCVSQDMSNDDMSAQEYADLR